MVKRSLRASPLGSEQAKRAFARKGWTQDNLAGEAGLKTRQSIWRFFTGQPIDRQVFLEICLILELDWREIALDPPAEFPEFRRIENAPILDIDILVRQVRSQRWDKVQDQCGTLQLLDISHPVKIDDIYVDVNTLEEIPNQQWLELADLQHFTSQEFDQLELGNGSQTQIAGMETVEIYSKLRVLGKPGAGKTTFLQHLAIRCNQGRFAADRVPIFVTLRDFADESREASEFSLLNYIRKEFIASGIADLSAIETLLQEGRVLLLLDGLDEVLNQERQVIVKEIRRISENYPKNLFVITCRTATKTVNLGRFTDVEMAPFTQEQIVAFAQKWFTSIGKAAPQAAQEQAIQFIERLELPEHIPFRRLAVTPLFLHLACWVFHSQGKFPTIRSKFYKQCLDLLLGKWDETKGIERDEMYHGFLLPQKLRLLSQVATTTFEQGNYFFGQQAVEHYIGDYIQGLPNAVIEPETLQLDSEEILKAIELQHGLLAERGQGIFSFSYQIFQEYFTARKIVANHNSQSSNQPLEQLVCHLTEPRWREVFLLTATMLRSADALVQLMKQKIDAIVSYDPYLQDFLTWAKQKALTTSPSPAAMRAFANKSHLVPLLELSSTLDQEIFLDMVLDNLMQTCKVDAGASNDLPHAYACVNALDYALTMVLDVQLHHALQCFKDQLPDLAKSREIFQKWWQMNALDWTEQLRAKISKCRKTQIDWHFSPDQKRLLQQYYDAIQLLLDCLNSPCQVTPSARKEIESALLLSQRALEGQEWAVLLRKQSR